MICYKISNTTCIEKKIDQRRPDLNLTILWSTFMNEFSIIS